MGHARERPGREIVRPAGGVGDGEFDRLCRKFLCSRDGPQDDRFQQAYQVAKEFSLPVEAAVKVFELRKATEEEVNRIRADQTLAKEQRREALKGIGDQTQQAIASVLGSQAMQAYLNRDGHWLNNLAGRTNARE